MASWASFRTGSGKAPGPAEKLSWLAEKPVAQGGMEGMGGLCQKMGEVHSIADPGARPGTELQGETTSIQGTGPACGRVVGTAFGPERSV